METQLNLIDKKSQYVLRDIKNIRNPFLCFLLKGALSFLLLFCAVNLSSQNFTNPIYDLADPHIIYYEGYYYATGTTGSSVRIKKAATLESLKTTPAVTIFSPSMGGPCCDYWAPEIHRLNNKWYVYYTANNTGDILGQRIYVLENSNTDPTTGTWVDKGRIYDPNADYYAIDATVFELNGNDYILWSGEEKPEDNQRPQRIYIARMSEPWTLASSRVLLKTPEYSWEQNPQINEAPEIIKKNGKVFMVYSANACWTPDYMLGMMSMSDSDDPLNTAAWQKYTDPVFRRNDWVQAFGPGHHCFFKSPDGSEDWIVFHATIESGGACDGTRMPRAQKLSWNADGTPNFSIPYAAGIQMKAPSGEPSVASNSLIPNGVYKIVVKASGQVIDIQDCLQGKEANVQQNTDNELVCQKWNIQATEEGYYSISNANGGLLLAVVGCSNSNGANIHTWAGTGSYCSQWSIIDEGGGYYQIQCRATSKSLDVDLNTNNLQQYDYNGNAYQQFQLIPVDEVTGEQAEDAGYEGPDFKNENAGYHGTGYIDYANGYEDYITWTVRVPEAGNYNLDFRYALGSGNRPLELKVNGSIVVSSLDFIETGGWTTWDYSSSIQYLNAGTNTITLTAIGSSGPNIDELVVTNTKSTGLEKTDETCFKGLFTYPNPVKDILYINGLQESADLKVFSLTGQLLIEEKSKEINVSDLTKGTYVLKIKFNSVIKSMLFTVE